MSDLELLLRQIADPSQLAWNEETYDLALASGIEGADRARLTATLIDRGRQGDTRAILTLGHLQAYEALPFLDDAARGDAPWALAARRALVVLGHGRDVVDKIATDAVSAPAKMARVAAVMDLATVGGPTAIAALAQAVADDAYEVRMLAWDGLIAALDLEPWLRNPDGQREKTTRLELLRDLLACDLKAFVRIAVDELRAITTQLATGASPTSLGLTWTPDPAPEVNDQIVAAIVDPDAPYPIEAIRALSGIARRIAESRVAMGLDSDPSDPRVPAALVQLGAAWTAPAVEEAAATKAGSPEVRDRLVQAARRLRAL